MNKYLRGITFVEILVVMVCLLILVPSFIKVFQFGKQTSVKGIKQAEITLEGVTTIAQITKDLKQSCWIWRDSEISAYNIDHILEKKGAGFPKVEYTFLSFPQSGSIDDIAPRNNGQDPQTRKFLRRPSKITYAFEPVTTDQGFPKELPVYALIRSEKFNSQHPDWHKYPQGIRKTILSKRVVNFDITPYTVSDTEGTQRQFFWVTLQLVEQALPGAKIEVGGSWKKFFPRTSKLIFVDFFQNVSPQFLESYRIMAGPKINMSSDYSRITYFDPTTPD